MNTSISIKLSDIKERSDIPKYEKYNVTLSRDGFLSIHITPKNPDSRDLLCFTLFKGTDRWICGMTKTSYYTSYVYSETFYDDSTLDQVVEYVESVLKQLQETLNNLFHENNSKVPGA